MENRGGIHSATTWLYIFAFYLGVRPLAWCKGVRGKLQSIYTICLLMFFTLLAFMSVMYRRNSISELHENGNSIDATMFSFTIIITSISFIALITFLFFVINKGEEILYIMNQINKISVILHYDDLLITDISKYFKIISLPLILIYIIISLKEIILYYDYVVFYAFDLDSLLVFVNVSLVAFEEQMKVLVFAKWKLFYRINQELKDMLFSLVCSNDESSNRNTIRLQELRKTHAELYDLEEAIMTAFDYPLLINLLMVTINIVQGIYFGCVCMFSKAGSLDGDRILLYIDSLVWIIVNIIRILIFIQTCNRTSKAAEETRQIVQKLEYSSVYRSPFQEEVCIFHTQLLHCSTLHYCVFSMFPLDMTLFATIMGTAATYIVILMQFHTTE